MTPIKRWEWPSFALEARTNYILTDAHMVAGEVCEGAELTEAQRKRLVRAREYLDRILGEQKSFRDLCADVEEAVG